jgi:diaminohydroxyphosphoribosylaminopyrimidine deaminase/5-amino-6-(5-phosphoribosylamino)uracil reductase
LRERGAEVAVLPEVSPQTALADLGGRGVSSLLVEGGRDIATAFFAADLFDRLEVAVAGRLLAGQMAPGPLGGRGVERLSEAPSVDRLKARKCGSDQVLSGLNSKCLRELFANLGL